MLSAAGGVERDPGLGCHQAGSRIIRPAVFLRLFVNGGNLHAVAVEFLETVTALDQFIDLIGCRIPDCLECLLPVSGSADQIENFMFRRPEI